MFYYLFIRILFLADYNSQAAELWGGRGGEWARIYRLCIFLVQIFYKI